MSGRSSLRRLVLGYVPDVVARNMFGTLGASQSLSSLQLSDSEPFSRASYALLAAALKRNTTLRNLAV